MIRRLTIATLLALTLCSCRTARIPTPDPRNSVTTDWISTNGAAAQITLFPARISIKKRENLYARVSVRNDSDAPFCIPKANAGDDFGRFEIDTSPKSSAILTREWREWSGGTPSPPGPRPDNYCVVSPGETISATGLLGILRPPVKGNDPRPVLMLRTGTFETYRVRTGFFRAFFSRRGADRFFLIRGESSPDDVQNMEEAVGAPAWVGEIRTPCVLLQIVK